MSTHLTHCALRLGDNLAHVHFLRKMAAKHPEHEFTHAAHAAYLPQLADLIADVPNLNLSVLKTEHVAARSVNAWKNAGGHWDRRPTLTDYGTFMLEHFERLARLMGLESPLMLPTDLLFDYPALRPDKKIADPFDILVINSAPLSGQFLGYNENEMEMMIAMLARNHRIVTTQRSRHKVTCAADYGFSVTQIGQLSQACRAIVMVATGPSWPTFNVWNLKTIELRVILSDLNERVDLAPNTIHANKISAVRDIMMSKGFL